MLNYLLLLSPLRRISLPSTSVNRLVAERTLLVTHAAAHRVSSRTCGVLMREMGKATNRPSPFRDGSRLPSRGGCPYRPPVPVLMSQISTKSLTKQFPPNVTPWMSLNSRKPVWAKAGATAIVSITTIRATTVNSTRMRFFMRYSPFRKRQGDQPRQLANGLSMWSRKAWRNFRERLPTFIWAVQVHILDGTPKGAEDGLRRPRHRRWL